MTQQDYDAFGLEFRRLYAALSGYKTSPAEMDAKVDAYFHALKGSSLEDVKAKADLWLAKQTKMPKPAEWAGVIVQKTVDVPLMLERDAREWRRAELSRWQGEPCACQSCVEAGVSEKPIRFAPVYDGDTPRTVKEPLSGRIVTAGEWLHGWPLFRWYDARASFYDKCLSLGLRGDVTQPKAQKRSFKERLEAIFPAKETVA